MRALEPLTSYIVSGFSLSSTKGAIAIKMANIPLKSELKLELIKKETNESRNITPNLA